MDFCFSLTYDTLILICTCKGREEVKINLNSQMPNSRKPLVNMKMFISGKNPQPQSVIRSKCYQIMKCNLNNISTELWLKMH